jgi:hypothetical protein
MWFYKVAEPNEALIISGLSRRSESRGPGLRPAAGRGDVRDVAGLVVDLLDPERVDRQPERDLQTESPARKGDAA